MTLRFFSNNENVALLQIALRWRRKSAGAKKAHEIGRNVAFEIAAMHAMRRDLREFRQSGEGRVDRETLSESFGERGLQGVSKIDHRIAPDRELRVATPPCRGG
ncbi:MAG TPA: hypothetical protein VG986_10900 [Pseudolabrys sp.]|nr:hypothetical protein [Pseudolabrys sp.]